MKVLKTSTFRFDGSGDIATDRSAHELAIARHRILHPDAKPKPVPGTKQYRGRTCECGLERATFPDRASFDSHRAINGC